MKIIDAVWCEHEGKTMPIEQAEKLIEEAKKAESKANGKTKKGKKP